MEIKYAACRGCGTRLPLDADHFYRSRHDRSGFDRRCKPCDNARRARFLAKRGAEYKDKPCFDCGGVFPPCAMSLDHGERRKTYDPSVLLKLRRAAYREELAACVPVCLNCHAIRSLARRIKRPPA